MRTIEYHPQLPALKMIDQRQLPQRHEVLTLRDLEQVVQAIQEMAVRGAPAIGVTAAFGMALAGRNSEAASFTAWEEDLRDAAQRLINTRPTAVNLQWAVKQALAVVASSDNRELPLAKSQLEAFAQALADEDITINRRMAQHGAGLIQDKATVIHHCNTGALAAVDYGTALGVIRFAHESGKEIYVLVDETRPRLQGARLTAWELSQYGIRYDVISDNAAGYFLQRGEVDAVLVGADRIAANGDVANKIGTYMLALAAKASSVPFYCVAPRSTFDLETSQGSDIPIEARDSAEVLSVRLFDRVAFPDNATARNPAFDVTPHALISAFVTEYGVIYPPFDESIPTIFREG